MPITVVAGPDRDKEASWDAASGELSGDTAIVEAAKALSTVLLHPEEEPVPVDWHDPHTAISALIEAAGSVYGDSTVIRPQLPGGLSEDEASDHILYGV